jgi:hypothetical protein
MDRARFVEIAPYYYAIAIASVFRKKFAEAAATRSEFWDKDYDGFHPDDTRNFLEKEMLFEKAISILLDRRMTSVIQDEFAPDIYIKLPEFDDGWSFLSREPSLPFYKYELGGSSEQWLHSALGAVNAEYHELGIVPEDFEVSDFEWQPLTLDRSSPTLVELTEKLDETIDTVRADNGYSVTLPEEREYVLESLTNASEKLKTSESISRGYLRRNIVDPAKTLLLRFKNTTIGLVVAGLRSALEAWVKSNAVDMPGEVQKWFHGFF